MAAGALGAPGTKAGPCIDDCMHRDCRETRRQAEARCAICGGEIGYNRRFYMESRCVSSNYVSFSGISFRITHASCLEDQFYQKGTEGIAS